MIKTIGIIDDDKIFQSLTIASLKNYFPDADYFIANNGEEALQYLEKQTPWLLLLDLNMPVMNGWEFLAKLKKITDHVKFSIYITTSSVDPIDKKRAKKNPFVKGFIEKPLTPEKMQILVQGVS